MGSVVSPGAPGTTPARRMQPATIVAARSPCELIRRLLALPNPRHLVLPEWRRLMHEHLTIISGRAHPKLAGEIAAYLGIELGRVDIWNFPDGEIGLKLEENIRGRDIFIVQPTCPPGNENLMELLILIDACKRASADRITTVIPYFGYARQDRKDAGRVPITAKLVANLIVEAGADRVLAMDLHAAQIQGFFDVPVDHLYAAPILDEYFASLNLPRDEIVLVSPDEGSIKRTLHHQERLGGRSEERRVGKECRCRGER